MKAFLIATGVAAVATLTTIYLVLRAREASASTTATSADPEGTVEFAGPVKITQGGITRYVDPDTGKTISTWTGDVDVEMGTEASVLLDTADEYKLVGG